MARTSKKKKKRILKETQLLVRGILYETFEWILFFFFSFCFEMLCGSQQHVCFIFWSLLIFWLFVASNICSSCLILKTFYVLLSMPLFCCCSFLNTVSTQFQHKMIILHNFCCCRFWKGQSMNSKMIFVSSLHSFFFCMLQVLVAC